MSRRQVTVTYSGDTHLDIDEGAIADTLGADPDDDAIDAAIRKDIDAYMEHGSDVQPVSHNYEYDRADLIASVRAEIARRRADDAAKED